MAIGSGFEENRILQPQSVNNVFWSHVKRSDTLEAISASECSTLLVPKVSIVSETGLATPIA